MNARLDRPEDPRLDAFRVLADAAELARRGLIAVEGRLVVERLISETSLTVESVLVTDAAKAALAVPLSTLPDGIVHVVPRAWMEPITGFNLHRGCVALARRPAALTLRDVLDRAPHRLLLLEGVGNPDNIGGLFRTARAFSVDGVVLDRTCGDPLYRKAIRVSCGASVTLPFAKVQEWPAALDEIRARGISLIALSPAPHLPTLGDLIRRRSLGRDIAVMVGAEGPGLSGDSLVHADAAVRIPMDARTDSLNVTVAAGIALHALF
jgi:tRNA G18 (ribose-2'-O)-methylase SpoU